MWAENLHPHTCGEIPYSHMVPILVISYFPKDGGGMWPVVSTALRQKGCFLLTQK